MKYGLNVIKNKKAFIIATLRRSSYRWPARNAAMKKAWVSRGIYTCAKCDKDFARKEVQVDHINPIIGPEGFTTWDSYIENLYCEEHLYQVLCKPCHKIKTFAENAIRKILRKTKKESENGTTTTTATSAPAGTTKPKRTRKKRDGVVPSGS